MIHSPSSNFFLHAVLNLLFPIACLGCDRDGEWLCPSCLRRIPLLFEFVCPICEKRPTPSGRACFFCAPKASLDGLCVTTSYVLPVVTRAIHAYKYNFVRDLSAPLADLLRAQLLATALPIPEMIIPVPLHPRRERWRGFNQSALLAEALADTLTPGLPLPNMDRILVRTRPTTPQMTITHYAKRKENMRGAFAINDTDRVRNKRVLLVDDVATTGATLFECADILKDAGAKEVYAVVIARQEFKKS